jgi:hypothetical protein
MFCLFFITINYTATSTAATYTAINIQQRLLRLNSCIFLIQVPRDHDQFAASVRTPCGSGLSTLPYQAGQANQLIAKPILFTFIYLIQNTGGSQ